MYLAYAHIATLAVMTVVCHTRECVRVHVHRAWVLSIFRTIRHAACVSLLRTSKLKVFFSDLRSCTTMCPAYAHIATLAVVFCARHCVRVHVHRAWVLSAVYQLSGIQLSGHSGMKLV